MNPKLIIPLLLSSGALSHADPILTSWFTDNSTMLARVIQSGTLTNPVTKQYYGTPNAGNAPTVPANAVQLFNGGPNTREALEAPAVNPATGDVTLTWSSVEGGTCKVEANNALTGSWTTLNGAKPADANATETTTTESGAALISPKRFYRVTRTGLNTYDP